MAQKTKTRHRVSHNGRRSAIAVDALRLRRERRDPRVCAWHQGTWAIDWSMGGYGCADCGNLYYTKSCAGCSREFLDFDAHYYDDIMSGPAISDSGDLTCVRCLPRYERWDDDDTESWEEDYDGYDLEPDPNEYQPHDEKVM